MTIREKLVRNTFWYGLVTLLGLATGVVMSVILARGLGPGRLGEYSYVVWAMRTMFCVAALGFALATVRYTADAFARGDRALAAGFVRLLLRRQLVAATVVAAVAVPLILVAAPASLRWPLLVVAIALFPMTIEHVYMHAVYGAQRYDVTAKVSALKMVLQLGSAALVLWLGLDILGLVVASCLPVVVSCVIQRASARRLYPGAATRPTADARVELRAYLVPLSVVAVLEGLVWDRSEVFFLRLFRSTDEIAFYSLAFGLATKAMLLPEVAVGALLPAFSALHGRGSSAEFRRVYQAALRHVAFAGAPVAAIGIALAPGLVDILYGHAYERVAVVLPPLVVVAVLGSLRRVAWSALRALGDRRCAVTATSVAAVVDIAIAALLIPEHGLAGALAANGAAQVVATVWALTVMTRVHGCRVPTGTLARIALAGGAAFAASVTVVGDSPGPVKLVLAAVVGLAAFAAVSLATRVIHPGEWRLLLETARRLVRPRPPLPPAERHVNPGPGDAGTVPPSPALKME